MNMLSCFNKKKHPGIRDVALPFCMCWEGTLLLNHGIDPPNIIVDVSLALNLLLFPCIPL